jgi:hypothetical protein
MKAILKSIAAIIIFLLLINNQSFSQESLMLHAMREVPQSGMANPAYVPPYSAHFSFLIPNLAAAAGHSGFAWNDLFIRQANDSLKLDFSNAIAKMKEKNYLNSSVWVQPFSFGLRFGQNYINLSSRVRADITFQYPRELFELLDQGNEAFIGRQVSLDNLKFIGTAWVENSVGYTRQINDAFSAGFRFKLINGLANAHLAKNQLSLYTDDDMYDLTVESDFLLYTSYPTEAEFYYPKSQGFGIDLGLTWKLADGLLLSAGVIDLGRINWRENQVNYKSKENSAFTFSGLDLNDFFNTDDDIASGFEALSDSLENIFGIEERNESYYTPLPTTFHLGGNYRFTDNDMAGALVQLRYFEKSLIPSLSLMYHRSFGHVFAATAAVSYHNQRFDNLGLGMSLNLGFFQMYALSGNLLSVFVPHKSQNVGAQLGVNFLIGRPQKHEPPLIIIIEDDFWDKE